MKATKSTMNCDAEAIYISISKLFLKTYLNTPENISHNKLKRIRTIDQRHIKESGVVLGTVDCPATVMEEEQGKDIPTTKHRPSEHVGPGAAVKLGQRESHGKATDVWQCPLEGDYEGITTSSGRRLGRVKKESMRNHGLAPQIWDIGTYGDMPTHVVDSSAEEEDKAGAERVAAAAEGDRGTGDREDAEQPQPAPTAPAEPGSLVRESAPASRGWEYRTTLRERMSNSRGAPGGASNGICDHKPVSSPP